MWKAGCEREYCEKLAEATDSAVRAGWIPQVVKGEVCEQQPNHTDSWSGTLGTFWEIGPCQASVPGNNTCNSTQG